MDELSGNINMKGDGHVGGELILCEKGMVPQEKVSTKDKYFALLGLMLISGTPPMCVIIFSDKRRNPTV